MTRSVALTWARERAAVWDEDKKRIVGDAPKGAFDARYRELPTGAPVPGEWWHVEDQGEVVGFGWLEVVWGDAEVLFAVDPAAREKGVGAFVVEHLGAEARSRGLRYMYNTVRPTHPEADRLGAWLAKRGFKPMDDGSMRAMVK